MRSRWRRQYGGLGGACMVPINRLSRCLLRKRCLSIALRVLTLVECVGRRQLAAAGAKLAGLSAGNPKRDTDRPTAERLLEALQDSTRTIIKGPHQTDRHM